MGVLAPVHLNCFERKRSRTETTNVMEGAPRLAWQRVRKVVFPLTEVQRFEESESDSDKEFQIGNFLKSKS